MLELYLCLGFYFFVVKKVIDMGWLIQERPGLKQDWFSAIILFWIKNWNTSLKINLSKIFLKIGKRETSLVFTLFVI